MIKVSNLSKQFTQENGTTRALKGINFEFHKGLIAIVGESGSGKTTLLNILCGLDLPSEGEVYYNDTPISKQNEKWLDDYRNTEIGIVFQDFLLMDEMSVADNVKLALSIQRCIDRDIEKEISEVLRLVGLEEQSKQKAVTLSGGQKQRVAIARALIKKPKVIIADEPTGNLDEENSSRIFELLKKISTDRLVIVVSHNSKLCEQYADRILCLNSGMIVSEEVVGENDVVREQPNDEKESIPTEMGMSDCLLTAVRMISKRVPRLIVFGLTMSIALLLMIMCMLLKKSDYPKAIADYLRDENVAVVPLCIEEKKQPPIEMPGADYIRRGRKTKEFMASFFGEERIASSVKCDLEMLKDDVNLTKTESIGTDLFVVQPEALSRVTLEGTAPQRQDEIVITSGLAGRLGVSEKNLPQKCLVNSVEHTVVGIVVLVDDVHLGTSVKDHNLGTSNDGIWMVGPRRCEGSEALQVVGFDSITTSGLRECLYSSQMLTSVSKLDESAKLIAGSFPKQINEIAVADYYLAAMGLEQEDVLGKTFLTEDLYDERYGKWLWEYCNLFDFAGKEVTITGVYSIDDARDFVVSDELFEKLDLWDSQFNMIEDYVLLDRIERDELSQFMQAGGRIEVTTLEPVYQMMKTMESISSVFYIVILGSAILFLLLAISFFSYSIRDNMKRIAILRSIGVRKWSVARIFSLEAFLISSLVFIVSTGVSIGLSFAWNAWCIRTFFEGEAISMISLQIPVYLAVALFCLVATAATVFVPIWKLNRKTPMEIIKG
ncbi:MAG: ABC transporter ATP-binding protein/permease [Lachnospiraceae bacterium]|nr:ABC transporter ATP-binding protein/permease [Lachnospiraceae bacterium]